MTTPHLTVLGNACTDRGYRLAALPRPGETVLARTVTAGFGGKGLNQAIAAARAGAATRLIAPVGTDAAADRIAALLRAEGIDARDLIARDGDSDTSVILTDAAGENAIVSDTRQAEALLPAVAVARLRLAPGDILAMQGNLSRETTHAAIAAARRVGATVALNAAPMRDWLDDLAPDILIANRGEAASLAGLPETASPQTILAGLHAQTVAVTLGPDGCLLRVRGATLHIPAPRVTVRDTSGAGDAFCGVFLAEWLATGDAAAAGRLAVLAASAAVTRAGTLSALPARAELDRLRDTIALTRSLP